MNFIAFGINHKSAPVNIRDKVAIAPDLVHEKIRELIDGEVLREGVLLSTCNRTEILLLPNQQAKPKNSAKAIFIGCTHQKPSKTRINVFIRFFTITSIMKRLSICIQSFQDSIPLLWERHKFPGR